MADQRDGGIAWTEATWNPVRGCSRVSPGCTSCYAERQAARFSGPGQPYEGLVRWHTRSASGGHALHPDDTKLWEPREREPRWTGVVRLVPEHLADPLRWRRPRRIFVNSMSDLFHEALPDSAIDEVLAVMLVAPAHTFQVLTKRAARMRAYFADPVLYERVLRAAGPLRVTFPETMSVGISNPSVRLPPWIWLGVSVEDQKRADERIPELLATPAAVRFVSYEPALAAVDFAPWVGAPDEDGHCVRCGLRWIEEGMLRHEDCPPGFGPRLDWVIVGGESGPGARPFDLSWARSTIRQCREAGVAAFFKQAGSEWARGRSHGGRNVDRKGGDPAEWPEDLRVREFPEVTHG